MLSSSLSPVMPDPAEGAGFNHIALAERIAQRLGRQYPRLTDRERIVCGYTLAGYTAEGISLILGIGISTIVTYRRRAYSRLGVSNANQLIAPLLA
ncbi:helix-turn-helix domain-containing protein [Sphingobium sp. HWE2-09]|uniref:helix-turn-helix domain-containing protein n=1 Tax=Sphingobium sp. HWE2-09 TaxID=3108390 RepID=UPI002DD1C774|nr:helix-turn-helix transcriptional regulator [Sphingobium sp. HWE2-09]